MNAVAPIDFARRRRWPPLGVALAVLGTALVAWQAWLAVDQAEVVARHRAGLAALQRSASQPRQAMSAEDAKRHNQIAAVARYLATPWGPLLELFESHASTQIAIVRLEPDAAASTVELTARAANTAAMSAYLIKLERDPRLSGVMLHHHEVLQEGSGTVIEFSIGAGWTDAMGTLPRKGST
jgi:hypothetical protein